MKSILKSNRLASLFLGTSLFASTLVLVNCSSKSSSSGSSSSGLDFSAILGEDMVVASPTAQRSLTASISSMAQKQPLYYMKNGVLIMAAPTGDADPADKKKGLDALLDATAESSCSVDINLTNAGNANCYGPSVSYTNHEFNNSNGSWPGGDLGIWEESNTGGEACIASQLNNQVKGAASYIDLAQYVTAGLGCLAKTAGNALPAIGESINLASSSAGKIRINGSEATVTVATLARESNDAAGNPVFVTTFTGTAGSMTVDLRVKHIPTSSDDSTNKGKVSVKVVNGSNTYGASLEYSKTSASEGTMLLKKVDYNSASADPYVSSTNLTVDFAKSWTGNANYLLASFNPSTYVGTFAYAWQAGNGDSHTRAFNAKISTDGSSTTGTGFFGFGPTMQAGPGSISGMICAWTGPDVSGSKTVQSKVQRQNMTLSSGKFVVSGTSQTVFDPVVDCEASGSMSMSWNSGSSTRAVNSTTENLAALSEVSSAIGTLPSAPSNVDE